MSSSEVFQALAAGSGNRAQLLAELRRQGLSATSGPVSDQTRAERIADYGMEN